MVHWAMLAKKFNYVGMSNSSTIAGERSKGDTYFYEAIQMIQRSKKRSN
jgi:hypothetical protein